MTRESLGPNYLWNIHDFIRKFAQEQTGLPKGLLRLIAGMIDKDSRHRPKIGRVHEALFHIFSPHRRDKSLPYRRATSDVVCTLKKSVSF